MSRLCAEVMEREWREKKDRSLAEIYFHQKRTTRRQLQQRFLSRQPTPGKAATTNILSFFMLKLFLLIIFLFYSYIWFFVCIRKIIEMKWKHKHNGRDPSLLLLIRRYIYIFFKHIFMIKTSRRSCVPGYNSRRNRDIINWQNRVDGDDRRYLFKTREMNSSKLIAKTKQMYYG